MSRLRLLLVVTLLAAPTPAFAGPSFGAAIVAGKLDTFASDDSPQAACFGASVDAGVAIGRRSSIALQLTFVTGRDRSVDDPFEVPVHDLSVYWVEGAIAVQHHLGAHLWVGARAGIGVGWEVEHAAAYPHGNYTEGGYPVAVRVGYDVHTVGKSAISIVADLDAVFPGDVAPFATTFLQLGVGYHFQ